MARSFCRLLMKVDHHLVADFNVANMSFNAIRENKILTKISEFTVSALCTLLSSEVYKLFQNSVDPYQLASNEP